ncbi:MAG TPA: hypothetical protein VFA46_01760, partial [Actinomycetes bacterium]|nr:hypothetical protein [Actinomycetes bacterium]
ALGPLAPPSRPGQAPQFASSERRWRGAVVRALAGAPGGLDEAGLAAAVDAAAADRPPGWFATLLARLQAEGLVMCVEGRYRLPA